MNSVVRMCDLRGESDASDEGCIRCSMLGENGVGFESHVGWKHHENVAWRYVW